MNSDLPNLKITLHSPVTLRTVWICKVLSNMVQPAFLPFPLLLSLHHRCTVLNDDNWTEVRTMGQIALRCCCELQTHAENINFVGNKAEACKVVELSAY